MDNRLVTAIVLGCLGAYSASWADGNAVDKVYSPYVQLLEREFEYRLIAQGDDHVDVDARQTHKLGYGQSLSDNVFVEAYVIGRREDASDVSIDSVELETKIQLTEQGQFDNDWGLMVELEHNFDANFWEINTTLLAVHEWSKWVLTGNLSAALEFGSGIADEFETGFSSQLKYRYRQRLEPAIELYLAQDTRAIGPVLTGVYSLGGGDKLLWTAGVLFGQSAPTPDTTLKFNVEYEF